MKQQQRGISITDENGEVIAGQIWNLMDPDDVRAFACRVVEGIHPSPATAEWLIPILTEAIVMGLTEMAQDPRDDIGNSIDFDDEGNAR